MAESKVAATMDIGAVAKGVPTVSLAEALNTVADPRHASGKRHSLGSVLCLAVCAMLCGSGSLYAIAQWGRDQGSEIARALGFGKKTPCVATLHRIFSRLDVDQFEAILGGGLPNRGYRKGKR
jgi:hypothetical protein